jgi:hypothetical protein
MRRQDRAYRVHERVLVFMGVIALLDTLTEISPVSAVRSPGQNRLIVLIDARGVGPDSGADPLQGGIEGALCERVPRPL